MEKDEADSIEIYTEVSGHQFVIFKPVSNLFDYSNSSPKSIEQFEQIMHFLVIQSCQ